MDSCADATPSISLVAWCLRPVGELFFAAYGDLWYGEIQTDTFDGEDHFSVAAYRYAPLATLETENATPSEIGVDDIGVSRELIYVQLSRDGRLGRWVVRSLVETSP